MFLILPSGFTLVNDFNAFLKWEDDDTTSGKFRLNDPVVLVVVTDMESFDNNVDWVE